MNSDYWKAREVEADIFDAKQAAVKAAAEARRYTDAAYQESSGDLQQLEARLELRLEFLAARIDELEAQIKALIENDQAK